MEEKNYKYLDIITGLFVAVLIVSNIASTKVAAFGPFNFDAGTVLFPISYIFGDILTEVYGYRRSRRIIWIGFLSLLITAVTLAFVQYLPASSGWQNQNAYEAVLGFVPRIVLASMLAYFAGEFSNSIVLAKMKVWSQGKNLWQRTIGSTVLGQAVDSLVFSLVAFLGVMPLADVLNIMGTIYIFKVLYEILATPLTYKLVKYLKNAERVDAYDSQTNFNPFKIN
ncbi:MAG: queuosine precursor transporter [Candidatus Doudnabacteria bacterium]|nr:queuosine precursor transporter [Candidatus Doudnabacteria bacterium]